MAILAACPSEPLEKQPFAATSAPADGRAAIEEYYGDRHVRARIVEYCGATRDGQPTAAYITPLGPVATDGTVQEFARSLWDLDNLIFFLQLDYLNPDHPEEPFLHPADVLLKLEPAFRACRAVCQSFGLDLQAVLTGRGYHFVGRIPLDSLVIEALAALAGETPAWHAGHETRRPHGLTAGPPEPWRRAATITARHARAAAGLGLLLEHVAHLILARAWTSPIPFVVNGTVARSGIVGRECVSIDFSHAGDPLDVTRFRTAFSAYRRHQNRPDLFGTKVAALPPLAALPRGAEPLVTFLTDGRGLDVARQAARVSHVSLPDIERGIGRLLSEYASSPLAAFHRSFRAECRTLTAPLPEWRAADLPPCITGPLERPNDLLLRSGHVQHVVRGLLAEGWMPAQIAALIEQTYHEHHEWGSRWSRLDVRTRAEFEVRVFAGLVATGADDLGDFTCVSAQEKGVCPLVGCAGSASLHLN
ncbi:MAG: hypothetical protein ACM4AI_19855 [Acidobacteriota bacterium]